MMTLPCMLSESTETRRGRLVTEGVVRALGAMTDYMPCLLGKNRYIIRV